MNKLEWCRTNAPEAFKDFTDDELLYLMESSYERFCDDKDTVDVSEFESVEYDVKDVNNHLDYIVLGLARVIGNKLNFKDSYKLTNNTDSSAVSSLIYEDIKTKVTEAAEYFKSVGVISKYILKETLQPKTSCGILMYDNTGKNSLCVDVGCPTISYSSVHYNTNIYEATSFKIERVVADKIIALLSGKKFRRPMDLYDLFCLTETFDFNINKVSDYILERTNGVGIAWCNYPFDAVAMREYRKAYNNLCVTSTNDNSKVNKPDFYIVFNRFCVIADFTRNVTNKVSIWKRSYKSCYPLYPIKAISGYGPAKMFKERMVICGEYALQHCGLVNIFTDQIQAFTNDPTIHNCENIYIKYYYAPVIDFSDCGVSALNHLIHVPCKERALLEYIKNIDYFGEGVLIEGLKNYIRYTSDYRERLLKLSSKYKVSEETLDYWINEALEDEDD